MGSKQAGSVSEKGSLWGHDLLVKGMLLGLCPCPAQHAWPWVKVPGQLSHYPSRLGRASPVSEGNLARLPETLMCMGWKGPENNVSRGQDAVNEPGFQARCRSSSLLPGIPGAGVTLNPGPQPGLYTALPEIWEPFLPSFLEAGCRHEPPHDGVSREERIRSGFRS